MTARKFTAKPEATCGTWPTWRITDQRQRSPQSGVGGVLVSVFRGTDGVLHVHVWNPEPGTVIQTPVQPPRRDLMDYAAEGGGLS